VYKWYCVQCCMQHCTQYHLYIKIALTCFGAVTPSSGSSLKMVWLHQNISELF
jgi:hypothetical protein